MTKFKESKEAKKWMDIQDHVLQKWKTYAATKAPQQNTLTPALQTPTTIYAINLTVK